ncbi:MAG: Replication-associated recombination protein A [Eubacteriales bacterium SKADARSKE-1]|nr:Replication-associated recombination protein A [Eubacteriales bacterium SKADARSKE-1]
MVSPLADRLRPQTVDDMVGQEHILGKNKLLRRVIESGNIPNMIFYGPPGTGKTTLAGIISKKTNRTLHKLNATSASTGDLKTIFSQIDTFAAPNGILLYLDEIQYFNKKQQQSLLEFIESGKVTLIASTTENPYFYIYNALLSRATIFEFKSVDKDDIKKAIFKAADFLSNESNIKIKITDEAAEQIANISGGDVRRSLNFLELCALSTIEEDGQKVITVKTVEELSANGTMVHDRTGDNHYDLLSAFQKSMRGSDPDASIYYLARLLESGELISACRRLLVCACEDVGLAYPQIIPIVKASVDIAFQVGMPEARIPLADAVVLVALSPKSNSAYLAADSAIKDINSGKNYSVPRHLQNVHCDSTEEKLKKADHYIYPHDFKNHWVKQRYLPAELKDTKYYSFGENKTELAFKSYWDNLK